MTDIEKLIIAAIIFIFVAIAFSYDNSESCESKGGSLHLSHYIPVKSGSITIMNPVYVCRGDE